MKYSYINLILIYYNSVDHQFEGQYNYDSFNEKNEYDNHSYGNSILTIGLNDNICQYRELEKKLIKQYPLQENIPYCWDKDKDIELNDNFQTNFLMQKLGKNHTCFIDNEFTLHCSGDNSKQQSNAPSLFNKSTIKFTLGYEHTCAVTSTQIRCWGDDTFGQLEIPILVQTKANRIKQIVSGPYSNCIRFKSGHKITCWGRNSHLLNRDDTHSVDRFEGMMSFSFGTSDTICAIMNNQTAMFIKSIDCWGMCERQMCDVPSEQSQKNKVISVGHYHVCTIVASGLGCWGDNSYGQISIPNQVYYQAEAVGAGSDYTCVMTMNGYTTCYGGITRVHDKIDSFTVKIAVGGRHSCGLTGGVLSCWGNSAFGSTDVPLDVRYNTIGVVGSWDFNCALKYEMYPSCWGLNWLGQTDVPDAILKENIVNELAVGLTHSCVAQKGIMKLIQTVCWGGHNEQGQNDIPFYLNGIEILGTGDDFTCVISQTVYCFGNNAQGQNDAPKFDNVERLSTGGAHACVIAKDNTVMNLQCWGSNYQGQSSVPQMPMNPEQQRQLATGPAHTCIITEDIREGVYAGAQVRCWGLRVSENLQEGSQVAQPVKVEAGFTHDCVVGLLGSFQCWGEDEDGQCGLTGQ